MLELTLKFTITTNTIKAYQPDLIGRFQPGIYQCNVQGKLVDKSKTFFWLRVEKMGLLRICVPKSMRRVCKSNKKTHPLNDFMGGMKAN